MAALASVPCGALVVEDAYSAVFKLDRVRPAMVDGGIAEAQVRFPTVPFCWPKPDPSHRERRDPASPELAVGATEGDRHTMNPSGRDAVSTSDG